MKKYLPQITLALLALLLYGNTLFNGYSLDDDFVVYNYSGSAQEKDNVVSEILTSHYSSTEKSQYEYRPVVKLFFYAEYLLWGHEPALSHAVNLLLYIFILWLLYSILKRLFHIDYPWLPIISTIIFAAHPIHTEVVASLKNRDELLSFLLSLTTLWLFLRFGDTKKWYFLALAAPVFLLAYFSKSSALVFAALIPITLWFAGVRNVKMYAGAAILILASVWLARWIPGQILPEGHRPVWGFENPLYEHRGILYRLGTGLVALLFYIRLLLIPYPLRFYYGYDTIPLTRFPDVLSVASLILFVILVIIAIRLLRKKHPLSYAIIFFMVAISMFSNIVKPAVGIVAERYAFAASLGFCIAMAFFILRMFRFQQAASSGWLQMHKGVRLLLLIIIFIYGARTISRNAVWDNHLSLFYNDIQHCENSFKANLILANTLQAEVIRTYQVPKFQKRNITYLQDAEKHFRKALSIYDRYPNAWNSLGSLRFMFYRDSTESIQCFRKAISLDSKYTEALYNLGFVFETRSVFDSALHYYKRSAESDPNYLKAHLQLGSVQLAAGDTNAYIAQMEHMKKSFPQSDAPWVSLGNYYLSVGDTTTAFQHWEKAADFPPENPPLLLNLANYYQRIGNKDKYNHFMQRYNAAIQEQRKQARKP